MRIVRSKRIVYVLAAAAVAACDGSNDVAGLGAGDGSNGIREMLVLGTVAFYHQPIVIEVPDTVDAGSAFEVRMHTFGGGCERLGPTRVEPSGDGVFVTPWDYTVAAAPALDYACTDQLKTFEHVAAVRLDQPGPAVIRILAWERPADTLRTFTRGVWVR